MNKGHFFFFFYNQLSHSFQLEYEKNTGKSCIMQVLFDFFLMQLAQCYSICYLKYKLDTCYLRKLISTKQWIFVSQPTSFFCLNTPWSTNYETINTHLQYITLSGEQNVCSLLCQRCGERWKWENQKRVGVRNKTRDEIRGAMLSTMGSWAWTRYTVAGILWTWQNNNASGSNWFHPEANQTVLQSKKKKKSVCFVLSVLLKVVSADYQWIHVNEAAVNLAKTRALIRNIIIILG